MAEMSLHKYQWQGVQFLMDNPRSILADEMGLGKTAEAIKAVAETHSDKVLIICPNSVKYVWRDEIAKWSGDPFDSIAVYTGNALDMYDDHKWYIMNYEAMRLERNKPLACERWDAVIIDEAHRIKNRKAAVTKSVKQVAGDRVWLLTGTPILNTPDELWSLLNYLFPKTYTSYWRFVDTYMEVWDSPWGKQLVGTRNLDHLAREVADIMLRRTKKDVMEQLPEKVYLNVPVQLLGEQRRVYDQMREQFIAELGDTDILVAPTVLAQLTRLKQIATDPSILTEGGTEVLIPSAKVEVLKELLADILAQPGKKVVIFSQWSRMCARLAEELKCYNPVVFTGNTKESARASVVEDFQTNPDTRVFIGTIGAAGVGITLTAADTVIFTDKVWTPAYMVQAEDRVYARMNDLHGATIVSLTAEDTIEQQIEKLLASKADIARTVIDRHRLSEILK
jgi:SNF2 family DNA or RNA helicase